MNDTGRILAAIGVGLALTGVSGAAYLYQNRCRAFCEPARAVTRDDVKCYVENNTIVIRPGAYFSSLDEILALCPEVRP